MYEAGDVSYLDVLLSSENITDLISNYYLLSEVTKCDQELLEEIQKQKRRNRTSKKRNRATKSRINNSKSK